ncbi:MAG: hypothetical protein WAR39_03450 [Prevotella sp.]
MKLHIFNPEHDVALAADMRTFTAPHAARELRADLGFLPALWASDGDLVLVDDVCTAVEAVRHLKQYAHEVVFVSDADLAKVPIDFSSLTVEPWGWDSALKYRLLCINETFDNVVPSDDELNRIRGLSNRLFAAHKVLPLLVSLSERFLGESLYFEDNAELLSTILMGKQKSFVLKAPWSSSGRGLRYVNNDFTNHVKGWCANIIQRQGGIMIEPQYRKIKDFGMEFFVHNDAHIEYLGLSVFSTVHGAYNANVIATEEIKREMLSRFVPVEFLDLIKTHVISILTPLFKDAYTGPFGIDMMIVSVNNQPDLYIHPCVELNLRHTMGHVALALSTLQSSDPKRLMAIEYLDKYHLKVSLAGDDLAIPYQL